MGDLSKFVPCSPQRFVVPSVDPALAGAPQLADFAPGWTSHLAAAKLPELMFTVLGSAGEKVPVTLVAPPSPGGTPLEGGIVVVVVTVGGAGSATVICAAQVCRQQPD